jgi:hypothetical protein
MTDRALVSNAGDAKQVRKAGITEKLRRERELDDLRRLMDTDYGRRHVWLQLCRCKIFETSFTGNNTTFFNEGQRNIGLMLLADINEVCPEAYLVMLKEAKQQNEVEKA